MTVTTAREGMYAYAKVLVRTLRWEAAWMALLALHAASDALRAPTWWAWALWALVIAFAFLIIGSLSRASRISSAVWRDAANFGGIR